MVHSTVADYREQRRVCHDVCGELNLKNHLFQPDNKPSLYVETNVKACHRLSLQDHGPNHRSAKKYYIGPKPSLMFIKKAFSTANLFCI